MVEDNCIFIKGARANNLKGFDLAIERGKLVVITGISGSGKSSLAFDTLYAEGHRRFAESLSSFARQFLGRMSKPAVDYITGIPPAIAVEQKVNTTNPRSTIATTTEIYDYLRLLFAKVGRTYSPISGREVTCDTAKGVLDYLRTLPGDSVALVAAAVDWDTIDPVERMLQLKEAGFSRVVSINSGEIFRIDDILSKKAVASVDGLRLLIDRMIVSTGEDPDFETRVLDSVQTAFSQGNGYIWAGVAGNMMSFSNIFEADGLKFEKPNENLFSFNSPLGACPECGGYGRLIGIDEALVIPNQALSVYEGAIACWRGEIMKTYLDDLVNSAYLFDFPIHRPYNELTKEQRDLLWNGNEYFTGINGFFEWVGKNSYKIQYRYLRTRYSGKTTCRVCGGSRLRKEALYVKIGGKNIAEVMDMSIDDLSLFFAQLAGDGTAPLLDEYELQTAERPLKEIRQRINYMRDVGLGYLTLSRPSNT
ncbi:MAG: excinuclease ABC subunit A, partial [Bacteroidales bacterium]|nr:excinuclease ABC subunit A [Bacteroidales bacterium]